MNRTRGGCSAAEAAAAAGLTRQKVKTRSLTFFKIKALIFNDLLLPKCFITRKRSEFTTNRIHLLAQDHFCDKKGLMSLERRVIIGLYDVVQIWTASSYRISLKPEARIL